MLAFLRVSVGVQSNLTGSKFLSTSIHNTEFVANKREISESAKSYRHPQITENDDDE